MDETQLEMGRDRIGRLFQFLDGFNALRNPVVRHVDQAGFKFWLDTLPDHSVVERGWLDPNADFALSVGRPVLTDCPAPPHQLDEWLLDGWAALDRQIEVRPSRPLAMQPTSVGTEMSNGGEELESVERFDDNLLRVQALERWQLEREAWLVREHPARDAMAVFGQLYSLYGELERENGQIELVAGDAILDWYTAAGRNVYPLVLQTMQIELEPEVPRLVVTVSDRAPELNTGLLRAIDEIDSRVLPQLLEEFEAGEYEPFSGESMDGFLKGLAVRLHQRGQFTGSGAPIPQRDAPTIGRRPLFFTRKRNAGFAAAIEAILADIAERAEFPNSLLSITGIEASDSPASSDSSVISLRPANEDPEILFTKPANEEQAQIARRLERYQSVMVQGPPGTGKTHTIANLIGHLLAQGKRVLVTSHTAKALERVREVIVDDLQALAVSVVTNDLEGRSQLEQSVTEITRRLSSDNPEQLRVQAARLAEERSAILGELDQFRRALEGSVSSEYRELVIDGREITPSAAAREVHDGRGMHDWIPGPVEAGSLSLTTQEVLELYRTNTVITAEDERDLAGTLPAPSDLWTPTDFASLVSTEADLRNSDRSFAEKAWSRQPDPGSLDRFEQLIAAAEVSASIVLAANDWELEVLDAGRRGGGYRETWNHLLEEIARVETIAEKAAPLLGRRGPALPDAVPTDHLVMVLERMLQHGSVRTQGRF